MTQGVRSGGRVLVQAPLVAWLPVQCHSHVRPERSSPPSVLPRDRDEALWPGADEVISIPSEGAQGLRGTLDTVIDTVGGKAQRDLFA